MHAGGIERHRDRQIDVRLGRQIGELQRLRLAIDGKRRLLRGDAFRAVVMNASQKTDRRVHQRDRSGLLERLEHDVSRDAAADVDHTQRNVSGRPAIDDRAHSGIPTGRAEVGDEHDFPHRLRGPLHVRVDLLEDPRPLAIRVGHFQRLHDGGNRVGLIEMRVVNQGRLGPAPSLG